MKRGGQIYPTSVGYVICWDGQWLRGVYRFWFMAWAALKLFKWFGWEKKRGA